MSSEIGEALQSMPDSYDGVYNRHSMQSKNLIPSLFTVFEIDADDISDSLLVFPSTLTSTGLVPDAEKFQEYWVKKAFSSKPAKVMWLKELEIDLGTGEVLSFEIELSTEPVERIFNFTFLYNNELEVMKEMIQALSLPILSEGAVSGLFSVGEGKFDIQFIVPPNTDISRLWVEHTLIRYGYEEECVSDDYEEIEKHSSPFRKQAVHLFSKPIDQSH